eukprot:163420-Rhodomonas_salina.1
MQEVHVYYQTGILVQSLGRKKLYLHRVRNSQGLYQGIFLKSPNLSKIPSRHHHRHAPPTTAPLPLPLCFLHRNMCMGTNPVLLAVSARLLEWPWCANTNDALAPGRRNTQNNREQSDAIRGRGDMRFPAISALKCSESDTEIQDGDFQALSDNAADVMSLPMHPDPNMKPEDVILALVRGLQVNSAGWLRAWPCPILTVYVVLPEPDSGLRRCFEFSCDMCKAAVGGVESRAGGARCAAKSKPNTASVVQSVLRRRLIPQR